MKIIYSAWVALALALSFSLPSSAAPLLITWTGTLDFIEVNAGGEFGGSSVNDEITGSFVYGGTSAEGTVIPESPTLTRYVFTGFPFEATITNETTGASATQGPVQLGIFDNDPLVPEDAELINLFTTSVFAEGDPVDAWVLEADPGDPSPEWFIALGDIFAPLNLYGNTDFQANPPALNSVDLGVFRLEQVNPLDDEVFDFLGAGLITSFEVTAIPIPAAAFLFPSGLLAGLAWMRRRTF